jgi:type I restriction enzyme S subunit
MAEWVKVRIGDLCKTNAKSYSLKEGWTFVNYLDTGNITKNVIDEVQYIDLSKEKLPSRAKRKVEHNSVLFSTVRPNQAHYGIIKSQPENFLVSTGFAVMDADSERLDPDYLYYLLSSNEIVEGLHAIAEQSTSAYPSIKPSDIENLEVDVPDIETQKKISAVLVSIDEKIRSNTAINKNLEQQAQTIFRNRFLSQDTLPDSWTKATLGEVSLMGAGGDKPKTVSATQTENCPYPIYSNGISDEGLYGFTNEYKIKDESVTVSARGTIGFVCLRHTPYTPIVRLVTLIPNTDVLSAKYLYLWLRNSSIHGTGTTQQQLTVPDFRKTEIVLPTKEEMASFTDTVTPLFEAIWVNQVENAKLSNMRDALLPKLMSGELDVSEIDL